MASAPWTDAENDLIVADYFAMLAEDQAGHRYNKAAHNRELQDATGRARGSIEFKHQNISAVLKGLGEDWIEGYKPLFNFQGSLIEAVARWFTDNESWIMRGLSLPSQSGGALAVNDEAVLYISPPPTLSNAPPPDEAEQMMAIARRFDVAARDERNRVVGDAGESLVFAHEKASLRATGRGDLAERVCWTSRDQGDGAGFDIESFEPDGQKRLIEVKATRGWERTPFHISRNELAVAERRSDEWCLVRVYDIARAPKAFELRPPLERHVALIPTSFQANVL